jgi:succinate dehydrogenase/fumarate reductase flavoprotein subunit
MSTWHEFIQRDKAIPEWPYPVNYGKVNQIETDVLIVGGGIAGCHAAVNAARQGVKVAVMEVGMTKRSGAGGSGVDHWLSACTNPCSKVKPDEYVNSLFEATKGFTGALARYITAREGWDTLLDCEQMGTRVRDVNDEFKGADFRDEATKLLFAYDYENRHHLRVWGHNIKPNLYNEMKKLGVAVYDRVALTSLLTEGGRQGARVIGATGYHNRTGEFYVFKAKATVISTAGSTMAANRLWLFAPEMVGSAAMRDMNEACVGFAAGWNAGAEFLFMEQNVARISGMGYSPYSMGNSGNSWYGAPIVDADGKEVGWIDVGGKELKTVGERFRPGAGQTFMQGEGIGLFYGVQGSSNHLDPKLKEKIAKGELKLPLYADLTLLPESERRVLFGMMVANEGKTRIPIYDVFTKAGFDPDLDILRCPVMPPEAYLRGVNWAGLSFPHMQGLAGSGFLVDWDLKTSLDGLYAAGKSIYGSDNHSYAATTGRYAGRSAAVYAKSAPSSSVDNKQVESEKARIYAPLKQSREGMGWKELNTGIARTMQDYCGQYRSGNTLDLGLGLLQSIRESEAATAYAANPHELGRLIECFALLTTGDMVIHSSLARKSTCTPLEFRRIDYPEDSPDWNKLLPIRMEGESVKVRDLPLDYHLKPPFSNDYEANYKAHCKY